MKFVTEGGSQKEVRRTFKMLREVWLNIGVEKIDTHEGVMIKVLLDSGADGGSKGIGSQDKSNSKWR